MNLEVYKVVIIVAYISREKVLLSRRRNGGGTLSWYTDGGGGHKFVRFINKRASRFYGSKHSSRSEKL